MTKAQENDIKKLPLDNINREQFRATFELFTPVQRTEWYIKMLMSQRKLNFEIMGRRHRISAYAINAQVTGAQKWTVRVRAILEKELAVSLENWIVNQEK